MSMRLRTATAIVMLASLPGLAAAQASDEIDPATLAPEPGALEAPEPDTGEAPALGGRHAPLAEVSGMVASHTYPGILWLHDDSGHEAALFAVDAHGDVVARVTLAGATNEDWEDVALAAGPDGDALYVADTGDNVARYTGGAQGRDTVRLYRLAEPDPTLGDQEVAADAIDLVYPDGPHDCEAILVDESGDVVLVTKETTESALVFVARGPLFAGGRHVLEPAGTVALALVTAADVSRDGRTLALRSYDELRLYEVGPDGIVAALTRGVYRSLPPTVRAETIAFSADGLSLYTMAEGAGAPLETIALP